MNKESEDIIEYFSAYVKKSIKNTRWHYLNKKYKIGSNETMYGDIMQIMEDESGDMREQLEVISEQFLKGVYEIKLLLDQVEDYSLFAALSALPESQKKVILLRIFYEKSFKEIGDIMRVSSKIAENTYYNTIKKIRRGLGEQKDEL